MEHLNGEVVWVARADTGLIEPVSHSEAREYVWGGEYDERLEAMEVEGDALDCSG
ncbi:MAG: hypothetical protein F6K19_48470 [Cyanothece sp. SIO1E1]|nr:hypothetical protein [Cyanothece sp. SIO1E1]